jgi:hypothetical protein
MDRFTFTRKLLDAGTPGLEVNRALTFAIASHPDDLPLLRTLVGKADTSDGEALMVAIAKARYEIIELLITKAEQPKPVIEEAFEAAMKVQDWTVRLDTVKLLLSVNPDMAITAALPTAAGDGDVALARLLMENSADLRDFGDKAIVEACQSGSCDMLQMLLSCKWETKQDVLEKAFQAATQVGDLTTRARIFEALLATGGIMGEVVDAQLLSAARYGDDGRQILEILLRAGANPDYGGGEAICAATRSAFMLSIKALLGLVDLGTRQVTSASL